MAIARDVASTVNGSAGGGTSVTYSHTCTGSNLYLVVFVGDQQGDTVTGVTYNGVTMTQLVKETRNPNTGSLEIYAYGLANPATGAHNVVATRTGTVAQIFAASVSYTGVNQTTSPVDATAHSNGVGVAAALVTTLITTVADNTAVCGWAILDNGSIAAGTGWTLLASDASGFGSFESTAFPLSPPGIYSYTATGGAGSDVGQVIVSLAPAGAVAAATYFPRLLTLGVG